MLEIAARESEILLPSIVVGELLYGAIRSSRPAETQARVHALLQLAAVMPCDLQTASYYAMIRGGLAARGTPIPDNDIWIAAVAAQHGLTLAHRDKHFELIDWLSLARW